MIRPATSADVGLVLSLIRELAEYERLADQVVATEALLRESLFGPRPAAEVRIAEVAGEGVGFALFFPTFSTFLGRPGIWLEDLFVRPAHRGSGLGRALLAAVAREAVARGAGRLEWSVLDWNEPALGFYRALGAAPMADWTTHRLTGDALERLADSGT
ncbi:MAG: GNAT family N-acetyltransferase [Myxococcota bacterium]